MTATIILTASIQGFLIALGLVFKKGKNRSSNVYLSMLIFILSLELLFAWGSISGYNNSKHRIPFWILQSHLIVPPALWLFFRHNSEVNFKFLSKHLLYFVPAIIDILISTVAFFSEGKYLFFGKSFIWYAFIEWLPLLLTIIILFFQGIKTVAIYEQFKQSTNPILRAHFLKLIVVFMVFCLLGILWFTQSLTPLNSMDLLNASAIVTLFGLAYISFFNPSFFEIPKFYQNKKSEEFKNYDDEKEFERLNALFTKHALFTQPKLSLNDLSEALYLPPKYVSYLINTYTSSNFNEYINAFRVNEVLRKIPLEKNKTLLGIAMEAGFNSKSTFNQAFKQHTGKSPSEFLD